MSLQPQQSHSRRISIAELARTGGSLGGSSHRSGGGSGSASPAGQPPRFALLSRRVTRLIGLQKSLRGSAIREDSSSVVADDFMARMRPDEAPRNPRFSSTLSTEGQYATFKCYEKLARDCILAAESVAPQDLPRTRTPMEMLRTRFELANPPQQQQQRRGGGGGGGGGVASSDDFIESVSRSQSRQSVVGQHAAAAAASAAAAAEIPLPGYSLTAYRAPSQQQQQQQQHRRISRNEPPPTAPADAQLERQLRLSYRLENVMEIIDHLRQRRGQEAVTNQRFRRHRIQPAEHYQAWVRLWNRDFVVRPRGPGDEGVLRSCQNF